MQLEQYMKDQGLNWNDFEIVDDGVPCDGETPHQFFLRMTGRSIPGIESMTWDDVRKVSIEALNKGAQNPFVDLLMLCSRPRLMLRKKS